MSDLVKRLRDKPKYSGFPNQGEIEYELSLHHQAADRLEALQAERDKLRDAFEHELTDVELVKDQLCEGFCKDWPANYQPAAEDVDCAACPLRNAVLRTRAAFYAAEKGTQDD